MVIDTGYGLSTLKDAFEASSAFIDQLKLGWGTSLVCPHLQAKVALCEDYDLVPTFGGTLFEISFLQNKIDDYIAFAKESGIKKIEVSDGSIEIERKDKLSLIERLSGTFEVQSEYGSKDPDQIGVPQDWVKHIKEELSAGSSKVVCEGRESGSSGMYRANNELRTGLIAEIIDHINPENLIWEAPLKHQQVWFIKKFGPDVNLGNIALKDVISLETLRLGLRCDTLNHFHT